MEMDFKNPLWESDPKKAKEECEKELRKRLFEIDNRLQKEPYPHTNLDSLIYQAGIGLLEEILGESQTEKNVIKKDTERRY